jgi:hypothetical protein
MPMPVKTKRLTREEAQERLSTRDGGGHTRDTDRGLAVIKAARSQPPSWDPEARTARFVMSTQQVDRYGDIVMTDGIDTREFDRNPVGLTFHNSRTWPVAKWANLEKILKGRPARLEGDFILLPADGPIPEIDQTAWMIANGGIKACSIGFIPDWDEVEVVLDENENWSGYKFLKSELLECSVCAIPANPGALVKSADGDMKLARELIEEVLDSYAKDPVTGSLIERSLFEKTYESLARDRAPTTKTVAEPVTETTEPEAEIEATTTEAPAEVNQEMKTFNAIVDALERDLAARMTKDALSDAIATAPVIDMTEEPDADAEEEDEAEDEPEAPAETAAEEQKVQSFMDGVREMFAKAFGGPKTTIERQEPTIELPMPSAAEIAVARARATAALARSRASGNL